MCPDQEVIMPDNKTIAKDVMEAVGGAANVANVTHCMTRLRFSLKDSGIPNRKIIERIPGVVGTHEASGQLQIIIGQNVSKVYSELCSLGGFERQASATDNLGSSDGNPARTALTPRSIGKAILDYMSGSMVPIIPLLVIAGMFKTVGVVLGPTMLNLASDTNDLLVLCNMVYNASFYFIPIYIGYTASKKLGATPVLGLLLGGLFLEPTFVSMAGAETPFTIYGIPVTPVTYSQSVVPILLSVWVMSHVERTLRQVIPDALSTIFVPVLTIAAMLPLMFCALGPLGTWLGELLGFTLNLARGSILAPVVMMVFSALWPIIVMTGMHIAIAAVALANLAQTGLDDFLLVSADIAALTTSGAALAAFLRIKAPTAKELAFSYFVSNFVGGVGEPFLYGLAIRYKRLFIGVMAGGASGALVAYVTHLTKYIAGGSANFLAPLSFAGGSTENFMHGVIASVIVFVVSFAVAYFTGFTKDELAQMESEEPRMA